MAILSGTKETDTSFAQCDFRRQLGFSFVKSLSGIVCIWVSPTPAGPQITSKDGALKRKRGPGGPKSWTRILGCLDDLPLQAESCVHTVGRMTAVTYEGGNAFDPTRSPYL